MSRWAREIAVGRLLRLAATGSSFVLLLIVVFLLWESLPALVEIGPVRFASDPSWHPAPIQPNQSATYNILPAAWGTLAVSVGAVAVAAPLGIASALFMRFYSVPLAGFAFRRLVELMAGIPSVVFGLWGLVVVVPLIAQTTPWISQRLPLLPTLHSPGQSLSAGVIVLALMILPTICLLSDAALASVPRSYLRAAAALGLSRGTTLRRVVIPAARSGLSTAVLLAVARALGETMAVLMVCGNKMQFTLAPLESVRTLTANIALEMGYATGNHRSALFVSGLMLLLVVVGLVATAEYFSRSRPVE